MHAVRAAMEHETVRRLLCEMQDMLRDLVVAARAHAATEGPAGLAAVVGRTAADTTYGLDRVADRELIGWFERHWPPDEPVEVVSEGLDHPVVVPTPSSTTDGDPVWTCIVDTVDGTRGLMYDKRSAWSLAAVARRSGERPRLGDVVVAAMTELPTTKQWASDQISGIRGCGRLGLVAERADIRSGARVPITMQPSTAGGLEHGFASFARFLPQGKALVAQFEERVWTELYGAGAAASLAVFEDQYLATGGQFHELIAGHDRMLGDVRPLAFAELGLPSAKACHPYDCCTAMLLEEAGCVVTTPWGEPLGPPLDTSTAVAWVGFANQAIAQRVRPALDAALAACFPRSASRSGRR